MAYVELVPALIVAGCGRLDGDARRDQNAAVGAVAPRRVGKAAGVNSTLRELGGVFGIAVAVAVFAGAGGYASPQPFSDGFVRRAARRRRPLAGRRAARASSSRPGGANRSRPHS